jgi:ferric-dicitrate binding protein FerR (iron transport regulator)
MRNSWRRQGIAWAIASSTALSPINVQSAWAQSHIGATQTVVNDVKGVIGTTRPAPLRAGVDVFQDEVIRTGSSSASRVVFQDKTNLAVGSGSEVKLDRFVFDPNPAKSQVALSIARGVVRFATGSLPKSAYQITTPTATIGVRGTILTISVGADGTTIVSVDEGIALITGASQTVTVGAGMTTTISRGAPPTPPAPTPPAPPMAVNEMDILLSDTRLAAGPAAGSASAAMGISPIYLGIGAAMALGIGLAVSSNGGNPSSTSTSTTGTP